MSASEGGGREGDQGGLPSPSCARRGGRKGVEGVLINLFLMHHLVPVCPPQMLYNDLSPMENHHVSASLTVLRQEDNDFLSHLSRKVCGRAWKWVVCVLAHSIRSLPHSHESYPTRQSGTRSCTLAQTGLDPHTQGMVWTVSTPGVTFPTPAHTIQVPSSSPSSSICLHRPLQPIHTITNALL